MIMELVSTHDESRDTGDDFEEITFDYSPEELGIDLKKDLPQTKKILQQVQKLENEGYQFESAEASFELLVRKITGQYKASKGMPRTHARKRAEIPGRLDVSEFMKASVKCLEMRGSPGCFQSRRDCVPKPRVARAELPWVGIR